ncbi:MAG: hypothetical protein ABIJ96_18550 [Elusimicrobiota bacterium]
MKPFFSSLLAAAALAAAIPSARAFDRIEFVKPPLSIEKAGRLSAAAAGAERLYVIDEKKNELLIFAQDGRQIKVVAKAGETPYFSGAKGVAVGPGGDVFVADTRGSRIQVFDAEGEFLRTIGTRGAQPGQLSRPESVAVGADGRVYVADSGNHRVEVFTQEGIFLFEFGGKGSELGKLKNPTRIEVTLSDHIYVLDAGNNRLQQFNPDTSVAREYKLHGNDFAVDAYGFIYMLDTKRGKVRELGPDGFIVGNFGVTGQGSGQFKKPQGIMVAPDGEIVVVDTGNRRLQRVKIVNKLKVKRLTHNLVTKLTVTGPSRKFALSASALTQQKGTLAAFLDKEKKFVVFGLDGKEEIRFNREGKDEVKSVGGMAASPKYGLYVSATDSDQVLLFAPDGSFHSSFGGKDGFFDSSKKEGKVSAPHGIAVNEKGTIYVADTGNRRVDAFSPDGSFLFSFGPQVGPHEFAEPVGLVWDEAGFIYIVDKGLRKIFKCEPSGGFIKSWGTQGSGVADFAAPGAIAYDGRRYLYVLDQGHQRVMVFDKDGGWVTNFFAGGKDERSLSRPSALTVVEDELIVSDPGAGRIVAFKLHPRLAPPVHVSTRAADGQVALTWAERKDPWIKRYRVFRSSSSWGSYQEVAAVEKPAAQDGAVEAYQTYHYRVAVEAGTGDQGPLSDPVEVFIPGAFNQAPIEISTITIGNVFSANYKWYLTNPLGRAVIVNNLNLPFKNVKVSFRLKDFMDFATEKVVENLGPREKLEIPLVATLNNRILEVSEDTPIQAEVSLTYFEKGDKQEVSQALPLKVYSRNAITWEDPRRIANYITPKDPPVLDLSREILRQAGDAGPPGTEYLNENLRLALRIWSALGAAGVKFLPSPNNPFEKMSEDPAFPVDYTQFPRETLRRKSGECDDLVTLLASLFEGATVRTALLDYPGHLAMMFDTGSNDPMEVGLPRDRMIEYDGSFWLPLEATMIGATFEDATRKALHAYRGMSANSEVAVTDPRKSWLVYAPATLPKSEAEAVQLDAGEASKRFDAEAARLLKDRYGFVREHLNARVKEEGESVDLINLLGILEVQHGKAAEAKQQFDQALALEPTNAAAHNNLGSLSFVRGDFHDAMNRYTQASELDAEDAGVWMNLTRTALKLDRRAEAELYSKKAVALDKNLAPVVESLLKM